MNTILPIGSVVRIKGINKPMMIFGLLQKSGVSNIQVVDYVGVPYPEGNIGAQMQIGFQRHDTVEILFRGYETDEFEVWAERIKEFGSSNV